MSEQLKELKSPRVLVTGHDGYIGAVLVPRLVAAGYDVTGLDTFYFEGCQLSPQAEPTFVIRADIREIGDLDLSKFDAIIHLAALSNDPIGQLEPELTLSINYRATMRLARGAKEAGVKRFLYASSCSLYGKSGEDVMTEDSPTDPLTAYAKSKVLCEQELSQMRSEQFLPIMLRCATVFGLSPKLRTDLVVNNLTASGVATGKIQIMSDGTPWRPLIHVSDLARVYEFLLECPEESLKDNIFNVGFSEQNFQVRDVAEAVQKVLPSTSLSFSDNPDKDARSYRVSFERFEKLSHMRPEYDLTRAIVELVDAYRAAGLNTTDELFGRKYVRLKQVEHVLQQGWVDASLNWVVPMPTTVAAQGATGAATTPKPSVATAGKK